MTNAEQLETFKAATDPWLLEVGGRAHRLEGERIRAVVEGMSVHAHRREPLERQWRETARYRGVNGSGQCRC
jgi:hypothetical protein